jgi:GH15 family glucan-1,4-alpha-glucosidase
MYTDEKLTTDNIVNTLSAIEQNISNLTSLGGVVRYENDWYMRNDENLPPNPWFVCTLWLAQIYIAMDMADKALPLMDWSLSHTLSGGIMSEQVHPLSGQPVGVAPLVWSHAELINTALDLVAYQHKSATKELFS